MSAVTRINHARFLATAILLRGFPAALEKDLMNRWERVTFRIFGLGGADSRHKVGEYVRLAHDVAASNAEPEVIKEALRDLGKGYSIEEVLKEADWSDSYDGWAEELRYLLFRYDEHIARAAGERLNKGQWNKIWTEDPSKSIEHIIPQISGKEYIHHLGNLTMLPPGVNSSLKDKSPSQKAATYEDCGLKDTVQIGKQIRLAKGWDKTAVLERAGQIAKFIRSEWAD